ncbi:hypothetical protein TRICI_001538 [Trichomonascus ciferrii]|uniref:protein-tyrosine-phosphatase n=1 Tax=Trichomonascus ciferrii TaxID=44093 RepID=A0A642VAE9_9ASCO|nr:hypothetical protein TRICI_001538 [Trichomonascus ciferrii]
MGTHECYFGSEQSSGAAVRLATRSLGDLKTPPAPRRPRPAHLDLSAAKQQRAPSGLQTPNSATDASVDSTTSLHTKFRTPSLPANEPLCAAEEMSADELCALLSEEDRSEPEPEQEKEENYKGRMPPSPNSSKSATPTNALLLVDIRPFSQYAEARVAGAVNICIPSTLLKRSSFDLARFLDCMAPAQRAHLADLARYDRIVLYDASSVRPVPGTPLAHTLAKFVRAPARLAFLHGGFHAFANRHPDLVYRPLNSSTNHNINNDTDDDDHVISQPHGMRLKLDPLPTSTGVLGGAFSGNIRAEMEVATESVDIRVPSTLTNPEPLPPWLREVYASANECRVVARRFEELEQSERARLKSAFDPTGQETRLAGVEMGIKNRYHNIWPFDHSRVRLGEGVVGGSDYINANYISTARSMRRYIATQGPLPATYTDFWHVVWEQRVPVIVMLTPEVENGLLKCNAYWRESMDPDARLSLTIDSETPTTLTPATGTEVVVRRFTLVDKHTCTAHQVVQIQYTSWPDFGSPANTEDLLALSTMKQQYIDEYKNTHQPEAEPYALVHCSAGCGRTGTFCAIDTCVDVLARTKPDYDVVFHTVDDMRRQRLSMVQNLRQFALCYECILLWCAKHLS